MQVFSKYKYNVKNTISPWYQIINFNVSTYKVGPCFFFFLLTFFSFLAYSKSNQVILYSAVKHVISKKCYRKLFIKVLNIKAPTGIQEIDLI